MERVKRIVIPYRPRAAFLPFHERTQRWAVIVAHRRAGKTVATVNDLIRRAVQDGKSDGRYAYIAPFYGQAKSVAWDYVRRFAGPITTKAWESELRVELINGAQIRLYGADNPDAMRGLYFDGIVLDEYADFRPSVWPEVVRPALSDRKGWAVFIGTPKGRNEFASLFERAASDPEWYSLKLRASESGLLDASELAAAQAEMSPDQFAQEFECSFDAAVVGAIYAQQVQAAEESGRICTVPVEPHLLVDTWWDLGIDDATAIVFTQTVGKEIRVIDYVEQSGEGLPYYARVLQEKGYLYGKHHAPHDISVRELGTGRSRLEVAASLGIRFDIVPQLGIDDGIEALRVLFSRLWFDEKRCKLLIDWLRLYRREFDDKRKTFKASPLHDHTSHAADAMRYLAVGFQDAAEKKQPKRRIGSAVSWMGA